MSRSSKQPTTTAELLASFRSQLFYPSEQVKLPTLQSTISHLHTLLSTAISTRSSLSLLLISPPSAGKSIVLNRSLALLPNPPITLQLHGFLHTTPYHAWRSLASQVTDHEDPLPSSTAEALVTVNAVLEAKRKQNQCVLFVFDAFEMFACDRDAQSVLYAILNYLQDRNVCAIFIAMSSRFDVTDLLEKRIKSRFAPREIVIPLPNTSNHVIDFLFNVLDATIERAPTKKPRKRRRLNTRQGMIEPKESKISQSRKQVRKVAETLLQSNQFQSGIDAYLRRSRIMKPILLAFDAAMAFAFEEQVLGTECDSPTDLDTRVKKAIDTMWDRLEVHDTQKDIVEEVSAVELALLVSLTKCKMPKITFSDVYKVYETLGRENGMVRGEQTESLVNKSLAEQCWERLVDVGLVFRTGAGPKNRQLVELGVRKNLIDEVLKTHEGASTTMIRWAKEEARI